MHLGLYLRGKGEFRYVVRVLAKYYQEIAWELVP